ncbi:hypothetical protein L596_013865 [Steinernema carpocapsae]|uniref:Uncharacterized protein n=1 Tax=Steinernema carpocapsae TaxID=34508 RepID=A0A4U5P1K6_STECR|nr:hypothetical protein L596_013865 [Steinernema carpocapsae]
MTSFIEGDWDNRKDVCSNIRAWSQQGTNIRLFVTSSTALIAFYEYRRVLVKCVLPLWNLLGSFKWAPRCMKKRVTMSETSSTLFQQTERAHEIRMAYRLTYFCRLSNLMLAQGLTKSANNTCEQRLLRLLSKPSISFKAIFGSILPISTPQQTNNRGHIRLWSQASTNIRLFVNFVTALIAFREYRTAMIAIYSHAIKLSSNALRICLPNALSNKMSKCTSVALLVGHKMQFY